MKRRRKRNFFSRDEKVIKSILNVFAQQILYRVEKHKYLEDPESQLQNAMSILRIVDPKRESYEARQRALERITIIKKNWGESIPVPPSELRLIRNRYEHFDEYIDTWFSKGKGPYFYEEETVGFMFRYDPSNGGTLYYLEVAVNLDDLRKWVEQMGVYALNNYKERQPFE